MDSRITLGDKLELTRIENRLSVRLEKRVEVYSSQVVDETESGNMLISTPTRGGSVVWLSSGQQYLATFYTKSGLFQCKVEVTACYKEKVFFLTEISPKTELQKVQRREYYRMECRTPLKYRNIDAEEREMLEKGTVYNPDELDLEWKNAVMLDLSGGGVRFVAPFWEERESFLEVQFEIMTGEEVENVYAYATLLRCEPSPNNRDIYDSRIMFWKMNKGMREKIIRFIFEEQRKRRSKKLGIN